MCDFVPSAGPAIQLPLGRSLTQTSAPLVPPNTGGNGAADKGDGASTPPSSPANPHLGQNLNISA